MNYGTDCQGLWRLWDYTLIANYNKPVTVLWMLVRHYTPESETKDFITYISTSSQRISIFLHGSESPSPWGDMKGTRQHLHMHWLTGEESGVFYNEQQINLFLCSRRLLPLFSKAVHYINTPERRVWKKYSQCLCSQDMQKCETHGKLSLNTDHSAC